MMVIVLFLLAVVTLCSVMCSEPRQRHLGAYEDGY